MPAKAGVKAAERGERQQPQHHLWHLWVPLTLCQAKLGAPKLSGLRFTSGSFALSNNFPEPSKEWEQDIPRDCLTLLSLPWGKMHVACEFIQSWAASHMVLVVLLCIRMNFGGFCFTLLTAHMQRHCTIHSLGMTPLVFQYLWLGSSQAHQTGRCSFYMEIFSSLL